MLFRFGFCLSSQVRLVKTSIPFRPVFGCTWSRNYCSHWSPWMSAYGKDSEYEKIVSEALYNEARKMQDAAANFNSLYRGLSMAADAVESCLKNGARKVTTFEEISEIATIAADGDREIGEIIAKTKTTIGERVSISIRDGNRKLPNIELVSYNEMVLGFTPISFYFCTSPVLHNALVLIHEKKISNLDVIKLAIGQAIQSHKSLLIVTEDMDREVLGNLMVDKACIGTKVWVIVPFGIRDRKGIMEDLAIVTGAQVLEGMFNKTCAHSMPIMLGSCEKVSRYSKITIYGGSGDWLDIHRRCEQLRSTLETNTSYEVEMRWELEHRIQQLSSCTVILKVSGASEVEVKEKKEKARKAVRASRSVMKNGVVPGNGVALLYASKELNNLQTTNSNEKIGIQLLQSALKMPMHMIASNAGVDGSIIIDKLLNQDNPNFGYGEYTDMIQSGIVEPVRVTTKVLAGVTRAVSNYIRKRSQEAAATR